MRKERLHKMPICVYRHIRLDTNVPFYIGKGSTYRAHRTDNRNQYWHHIVQAHGYKVEIVKFFKEETEALKFEALLIKIYRNVGMKLTNMTDGGEGSRGYVPTEATRQKLSVAAKGQKRTAEARLKISLAQRGSKNHMYGKSVSKETRAKQSKAGLGRKFTPEQRERVSLNTPRSKKVHCKMTNKTWRNARIAAADLNIKYSTLRGKLNGTALNNTTLEYVT